MYRGRLFLFVSLLMLFALQLSGQPQADCSIGIPELGTPEQIGNPTILYYSTTGIASNCSQSITNPNWSVTGNALIQNGVDQDVVRIEASGEFQLNLQYINSVTGASESSFLETASNIDLNPTFDLNCGLNIILVLDESNSISHNEEEAVRQSVRSLLDKLKEADSHLAIVEFGTRAVAEQLDCSISGSPNFLSINTTNIEGCINTYLEQDYGDPAPYSGGTNWDDAFLKVLDVIEHNTIQPDLVLFVTDGNPTFYIDEHNFDILGGTGSSSKVSAVNHALVQANKIKNHARIFGVGIGTSVNAQQLKFISGIVPYVGDLSTSDYMVTPNFNELGDDLNSIANSLCGTNLSVVQTAPSCVSSNGQGITLEIEIENSSSIDADEVEVFEVLPPGFQFVSETISPNIGSVNGIGNLRIWDIGVLEAGVTARWIINGVLPAGESESECTAYVVASNIDPEPDDTSTVVIRTGDIELSESHTDNSCVNTSDGAIDLTVDGGVPPYYIQWSNGEHSEDILDIPAGIYEVFVEDANGCSNTLEVQVDHPDHVPVYVYIEASADRLCSGEVAVITGPAGFNMNQWYHNGIAIEGADSHIYETAQAGSYFLAVEDGGLCAAGISEEIEIYSEVVFTRPDTLYTDLSDVSEVEVCFGQVSELPLSSIESLYAYRDPEYVNYTLDANNLCMTFFKDNDMFEADTIIVVACDSSRCFNCESTVVVIRNTPFIEEPPLTPDHECFIPNVLTPNGDGYNESFEIGCLDEIENMELHVYNRWGTEVYYSNAYSNNWKGTYNGMPLPFGTYFFTLNFVNPENEHINLAGDVTILR